MFLICSSIDFMMDWKEPNGMTDVILRVFTEVIVPLAWPTVVLAVVFGFKEEISDALKHIEEAGPKGGVISPRGQVSVGDTLDGERDNHLTCFPKFGPFNAGIFHL